MSTVIQVPPTAKERGRTAPAKLAHFVLRTSRYAELIEWYKTVLEAEVVIGTPGISFLTYDDEHHRIGIVNMADLEKGNPRAAGLEHVAFTYATVDDLFDTYQRLQAQGIEPYWTINHGATLSFYYRDPDRNNIELQVDVFDTVEETNAWIANSDFEANPIGVKFDPESLIARHRQGEDRATLLARPVIDPADIPAQFPTRRPPTS